jgi:hypothetical protein
MGCGTRLFTRINAWVISHEGLGPAYGEKPDQAPQQPRGIDIVIGHTRTVYVQQPGDRVHRGDLIGRASDKGRSRTLATCTSRSATRAAH